MSLRRAFLEWNPLEWDIVDRCRLVAWIMLPFCGGYWIINEAVLLRPSVAPYYDVAFLRAFQYVLTGYILSWIVLLGVGPRLRRAPRAERALVWVTSLLYFVGNAIAAVSVGPVTTPYLMVLIGGVAVAFFLFDARPVVAGMVAATLVFGASIVGWLAGWIPYAPLLARQPYVGDRLSSWWFMFMSAIGFGASLALVTLFVYFTARLRDRESRLRELARTDPLTGVSNRRRFLEALTIEFERVQRYGGELSCAMLDIDHFKSINDRYGHAVGDRVLVAAADVFRGSLRAADVIARWGGEEFVLLLPQTGVAGAEAVAERCRRALEEAAIRVDDQAIGVTVSIGLAVFPGAGVATWEALVRSADDALYEAKNLGRNRVVVSVPSVAPPTIAAG